MDRERDSGISAKDLHERLVQIMGEDAVLVSEADRAFYSSDIFGGDRVASMVIRPSGTDEMAAAVRAAGAAGFSIIGRGGGTSYTGGFVPDRERSVVVDTSGLDRIVDERCRIGRRADDDRPVEGVVQILAPDLDGGGIAVDAVIDANRVVAVDGGTDGGRRRGDGADEGRRNRVVGDRRRVVQEHQRADQYCAVRG